MPWTLAPVTRRVVLWAAMLGAGAGAAAQAVVVHYNSRPPYLILQEGVLSGLTGSPTAGAFRASGISYVIAETPATRQLKILKDNEGFDCAIGWFKNPEREAFAKFTKPIYQDEPQVVLTAAENNKIKPTDTIESVLSNPDLTLLVKNSYSYGKGLDALIEKFHPKRQAVSIENIQMFKMIQAQRADYMFTAPEEAAVTIPIAGFQPHQFKLIKLGNMPKGEYRYVMCSQNVPDDTIARLNAFIKP